MRARRRSQGLTLLELIAVLGLTTLVLFVAMDLYVDLSAASQAAIESTRAGRRAAAVLDRVARDLEGAVMVVKPPDRDPLAHPWLFYADGRDATGGADRLKFITRTHRPRSTATHEHDLAVVSYAAQRGEDELFELRRASTPHHMETLDRDVPTTEEDGALLLADGLASFGVRFLAEEGEWKARWDSSTLVDSGALPLAAEIQLAVADATTESEPQTWKRQVIIPVRPLDLEELLARDGSGGDGDGDGELDDPNGDADGDGIPNSEDPDYEEQTTAKSFSECVPNFSQLIALIPDPGQQQAVQSLAGQPFDAGLIPAEYAPFVQVDPSCQ